MHREDHLVLGPPLDPAVSTEADPAYDVVTWRGRCPRSTAVRVAEHMPEMKAVV